MRLDVLLNYLMREVVKKSKNNTKYFICSVKLNDSHLGDPLGVALDVVNSLSHVIFHQCAIAVCPLSPIRSIYFNLSSF